jgi:hypothetical protein
MTVDKGDIYLKPGGGVWADIATLRAAALVPDADLLHALPPMLRDVCEGLQLQDPVGLRTHLRIDSLPGIGTFPTIYWDGEVTLAGATLQAGVPLQHVRGKAACCGLYDGPSRQLHGLTGNILVDELTLFNQPFRDIQGQIEVRKKSPDSLALKGLRANLFGGQVYGLLRVEFGPTPRYELNVMASQVRLEEFGRHNLGAGAPISGLATAGLYVNGRGTDLNDLSGNGTVDVQNGRLGNLPPLLQLFKFLSLRLPDNTAFDEAHAAFAILGKRVAINRLDLFGNSISLRGQGEMNLDGTDVNLDFYAVWARIIQYLPPVIKSLSQNVSQHLLRIKMRGQLTNPQFEQVPVPALVDPLKDFLERMRRRQQGGSPAGQQAGAAWPPGAQVGGAPGR